MKTREQHFTDLARRYEEHKADGGSVFDFEPNREIPDFVILQNARDKRTLEFLRLTVGDDKIKEAVGKLKGNRKPYPSVITMLSRKGGAGSHRKSEKSLRRIANND